MTESLTPVLTVGVILRIEIDMSNVCDWDVK